jgi:TrmH family RNA methyltransferase
LLTRNEILRLKSLHSPKGRKNENAVLIEGLRLVEDCLESQWPSSQLFVVEKNLEKFQYAKTLNLAQSVGIEPTPISQKGMERISDTKNPQGIALEIQIPDESENIQIADKILYLDNISDPGNIGTIMRTAAWFGVEQVLLSENCANIWNPKVVRSAMGAHFKIDCDVFNLDELLIENPKLPHQVLGAHMDGKPLIDIEINIPYWILILGNEARGISENLEGFINQKITIAGSGFQESLNVAVASGIILNHLNKESLS